MGVMVKMQRRFMAHCRSSYITSAVTSPKAASVYFHPVRDFQSPVTLGFFHRQ